MLRVVNIVGTRPNLVKMSPVLAAQRARPGQFESLLVHTGQHRDPAMSAQLLAELELPTPDVTLDLPAEGQEEAVERLRIGLEAVLRRLRPDLVIVVGDVNSTAAGALAAAGLGIPIAHVEAGLRSFDLSMPEEVNRLLVDSLSDHLFASETSGLFHLAREGCAGVVHHSGNVMIDSLVRFRARSRHRNPAAAVGVDGPYAALTLHRPSNVDSFAKLAPLIEAMVAASRRIPILFPVHPRTRDRLRAFGLNPAREGLRPIDPLGYVDMLALIERASIVLTDSGGLQEETTYLGVPCLTLRENTERPATVTDGTNRVIGTEPERIGHEIERLLAGDRPPPRRPPLWDGQAAERIVQVLAEWGDSRQPLVRAAESMELSEGSACASS